jgi:hypothetical protein
VLLIAARGERQSPTQNRTLTMTKTFVKKPSLYSQLTLKKTGRKHRVVANVGGQIKTSWPSNSKTN